MNTSTLESLQSWIRNVKPRISDVVVRYSDGSSETVVAPIDFTGVRIGPSYAAKSLDDVNVSSAPKQMYLLERGAIIVVKKKQIINVPGVVIQSEPGAGAAATLGCAAGWKEIQLSYTDKAADCAIRDLVIVGHDGAEFIKLLNTPRFTAENITQKVKGKGGIGVINSDGSDALLIRNITTERTGRYSIYLGDSSGHGNRNTRISDCNFGPSDTIESDQISEHCLRTYGVTNLVVERCTFRNPDNKDGKQAAKIMSGDGVSFTDCLFDGSTRFGRDKNDPPGNTLRNVTLTRCTFTDWVRIDPGARVSITDSTATAHGSGNVFGIHEDGRLVLKNVAAAYLDAHGQRAGQLSLQPGKIDLRGGGVTFNGKNI